MIVSIVIWEFFERVILQFKLNILSLIEIRKFYLEIFRNLLNLLLSVLQVVKILHSKQVLELTMFSLVFHMMLKRQIVNNAEMNVHTLIHKFCPYYVLKSFTLLIHIVYHFCHFWTYKIVQRVHLKIKIKRNISGFISLLSNSIFYIFVLVKR